MKKYYLLTLLVLIALVSKRAYSFFIIEDSSKEITTIPDGYIVDTNASKCSNGSIEWEDSKSSAVFKSNGPAQCQIYLRLDEEEVYYESLESAIEDFSMNTTDNAILEKENAVVSVNISAKRIKLLKDIILKKKVKIPNNLLINLNGHTLSFSKEESVDSFIDVEDNVELYIYGKKSESSIKYEDNNHIPIFSIGEKSQIKIDGIKFRVSYTGESVYSVLKDNGNHSRIFLDDIKMETEGKNINLFYSSSPVDIRVSDSVFKITSIENTTIINGIGKDANVSINSTKIIYDESLYSSNSGALIIVPNGNIEIVDSNFIIESLSQLNDQSKIIAKNLIIKNSNISSSLNSKCSIIDIMDTGTIEDLNFVATDTQDYFGITHYGNNQLQVKSSKIELDDNGIGIYSSNGLVDLENSDITAKRNIVVIEG